MVVGAALTADLTDAEWLERLKRVGEKDGYYTQLGQDHAAVFVERSHDVLFVAFETLAGIRSLSDNGMPVAFDVSARRGWSHLTLIADRESWFRSNSVITYFDRLDDFSFFEDFDRVVFYGAGMCGYAAAVYSVAAPGSFALLVAPQATLERGRTEWDTRFPAARRMDFRRRYGYAPDMLEAARAAYVIYDPDETEDAMHASLFAGPNIIRHRYRRGRAGTIDTDLRTLALIERLAEAAANGVLTPGRLARVLRARRDHLPYLRSLLARVLAEDRPQLTARLCRAVLASKQVPSFRHHLEVAERRLGSGEARAASGPAE